MANYNFKEIEKKWQSYWKAHHLFRTSLATSKPKFYVLDMFPYPSGAGLHVGHPQGYIASDIVARYKRSKGYNVLHPMGFDAFGLPAEQYAIQTGQHPAITTEKNIRRYKQQLKQLGFSFDWDREVRTCAPTYYQWTQWIFLKLFQSWYNNDLQKAQPIKSLTSIFEQAGNGKVKAACDDDTPVFTAAAWKKMTEKEQQFILLKYRLAFLSDTMVNWCPALGTVLANEEVKEGRSERGGYPVIRKKMKQWSLRITAYAARLLDDLEQLDWPTSIKEIQRNWIGKSEGVELLFKAVVGEKTVNVKVFTTRIDTIFGTSYLALAPEHDLVEQLTLVERQRAVKDYVAKAKNRSERTQMREVNQVTGVFTGAYATHPFTGGKIPIWVTDYVLTGYGTGAIMGVPAHDSRDYAFAKHFALPIIEVVAGGDVSQEAYEAKEGKLINSDFLNGLSVKVATEEAMKRLGKIGIRKVNYRLRDAIFSRQRYWGEPFPIYYKDGMPYALAEAKLPLELPEVKTYQPTDAGNPPLGHAANWKTDEGYPLELNTMPGWAGSSWYFFRYMDTHNNAAFVGKEAQAYWKAVDLYMGGAEHATGHLLYARFWTKFLYDLGYVNTKEPFQKLINQGMIQRRANFVYRVKGTNQFVSYNLKEPYETLPLYVATDLVNNNVLDIEAFKKWRPDFKQATFILEEGQYICGGEVEKMSKSKYNVVNPDEVVEEYGADTFRLYAMFLGPLAQAKTWNTHGIDGVFRFLTKLWKLFHDKEGRWNVSDTPPTEEELKVIHKTIQKIEEAIARYAFNTAVSTFMICVNALTTLQCNKKGVLQDLVILLAPFAPHIAEELWQLLGHKESVVKAPFPSYKEQYIQEEMFEYPITINGKKRAKMSFPLAIPREAMEQQILTAEKIQKWMKGQKPKKMIIVPQKIVNIVV